ncbi:energy transducer TonB family protein [Hahella ganghwensis]|uniref:energy transducer TonB family protein n=1 Tax=Hahella ganghwensis TaxID=286420 RepID=UPI00035E3E59|nr:energy transducer TonB [Hahella ganghwensis]
MTKLDSHYGYLVLALVISISVHIILWSFLNKNSPSPQQSTTMTLALAPGQPKNPGRPTDNSSAQPSSTTNEVSAPPPNRDEDIHDNALPWKQATNNAFKELSQLSANKPNLARIDSMFSQSNARDHGNTEQPTGNAGDAETIRDMLKSAPSTQSDFWPYLVQHLANNKYHDKQYPFSELNSEKVVVLNLGFQSNGMLVRAKVARSSGDEQLDSAAIRSAYAANPFEPPPSSDRAFDYNYLVQIIYSPNKADIGD